MDFAGFPLLVVFFVVSGFRAAFQFPASWASNWLFGLPKNAGRRNLAAASRKRVDGERSAPGAAVFLPFEMWRWGSATGLFHMVFQLATGALLIEVLFWSFDKVPFTCSYFPGKVNLALLSRKFICTAYRIQFWYVGSGSGTRKTFTAALLFFVAVAVVLALLWMRRPRASEVRFDGKRADIQP